MTDLFGNPIIEDRKMSAEDVRRQNRGKRKPARANGYYRAPGTGPADETCRSCLHAYATETRGGKRFWKCDRVKPTHGVGTDIRLKSPACSGWDARP